MKKDTFYFPHDYNSRSDAKIKKLIRQYGMAGYGIFWSIIEDLYQNNNELRTDYDVIAYELREDENVIKSIINDFDLFVFTDNTFGSLSIEHRLADRDKRSNTAKENARKRWGESDNRIKADGCLFYVLKFYSQDETFIKCGVTSESISRRYSGKTNKYQYSVLFQKDMDTMSALEIEHTISNQCVSYAPKYKFGGFLECYEFSELDNILGIAMQRECNGSAINKNGNAIKEKKRKESKENIQKKDNGFMLFWESYHNITGLPKTDREAASKYWVKLTEAEQELASNEDKIKAYKQSVSEPKYLKKARTYLADKNFNDEYKPYKREPLFPRMGN